MKKRIFLYMIIYSLGVFAENDYGVFLVQNDTRTFWANTITVCHPLWNMTESGLYFDPNGYCDWYKVTDENDTLSLGDGMDWNINVDHRSYELRQDTLFVIQWILDGCCTPRKTPYDMVPDTVEAYKIIYNTKQKLLLLDLTKDSLSGWVEYRDPKCNELNVLEFDCSSGYASNYR